MQRNNFSFVFATPICRYFTVCVGLVKEFIRGASVIFAGIILEKSKKYINFEAYKI
jgi:hypothetical protein